LYGSLILYLKFLKSLKQLFLYKVYDGPSAMLDVGPP